MNFPEMYGEYGGGPAEEVILVIDDDDEECFTTAASTPPPRWIGRTTAGLVEEDDGVADDWCLSPASRALEIARGQRELMDMIRTMPEDFYELSLKDLVDHHAQIYSESDPDRVEERLPPERNSSGQGGEASQQPTAATAAPAKMKRSGSVNYGSGFLLRLPISYLRSRNKKKKMVKKKKKEGAVVDGGGGRVSPKPAKEAGESERSSSAFSGGGSRSSESRSSKGSTSRGSWRSSSRNNSIRRKSGGRWCLFFSSSKGKVIE